MFVFKSTYDAMKRRYEQCNNDYHDEITDHAITLDQRDEAVKAKVALEKQVKELRDKLFLQENLVKSLQAQLDEILPLVPPAPSTVLLSDTTPGDPLQELSVAPEEVPVKKARKPRAKKPTIL